jgi:hypothetical protein
MRRELSRTRNLIDVSGDDRQLHGPRPGLVNVTGPAARLALAAGCQHQNGSACTDQLPRAHERPPCAPTITCGPTARESERLRQRRRRRQSRTQGISDVVSHVARTPSRSVAPPQCTVFVTPAQRPRNRLRRPTPAVSRTVGLCVARSPDCLTPSREGRQGPPILAGRRPISFVRVRSASVEMSLRILVGIAPWRPWRLGVRCRKNFPTAPLL